VQKPDGMYRILCKPPITVPESMAKKDATVYMTAELNRVLESVVREYPDQWLWLHNRWKSIFDPRWREAAWPAGIESPEYQRAYAIWSGR
jgi:lauroyl/myristoyl acyltransferase